LTILAKTFMNTGWRCGNDEHFSCFELGIYYHDVTDLWPDGRGSGYVFWLLLVSPALLMPLAWKYGLEDTNERCIPVESLAVAMLFLSWMIQRPLMQKHLWVSAVLICPWFFLQLRRGLLVLTKWRLYRVFTLPDTTIDFSGLFPAVGAGWLLAHRANWTPWNFDPLIVLLTAAHFHHAGFTLPLMAGLNSKASPGCWTRFSCVAILAGVPLVAAGITCTHFGVLRFVEPFGVTVLVLGALGVAVSQIRRGMEKQHNGLVRAGFVISGVSLLSAMILAMGFGLRHVVPNWALTMPQMWMIHGTLNAFGFGLCGLLAWRGAQRESGTGL
jgi:hypothetical protein